MVGGGSRLELSRVLTHATHQTHRTTATSAATATATATARVRRPRSTTTSTTRPPTTGTRTPRLVFEYCLPSIQADGSALCVGRPRIQQKLTNTSSLNDSTVGSTARTRPTATATRATATPRARARRRAATARWRRTTTSITATADTRRGAATGGRRRAPRPGRVRAAARTPTTGRRPSTSTRVIMARRCVDC